MTVIEKLNSNLSNQKHHYGYAMRNVKSVLADIQEYKRHNMFDGTARERLEYRLRTYMQEVVTSRTLAMKFLKKVNVYTYLTCGAIQTSPDNVTIEKIALDVENDFDESDNILESGDVTSCYDSRTYFNERVENDFTGTYTTMIERVEDYISFIEVLMDDVILNGVTLDFSISFDEWKTGYKVEGKRQSKLNKFLRKKGCTQYTLDYYSQQIKTEQPLYITVSDRVQHITGMSYFSTGEWDGMNGSSCQNPVNEYEDCIQLLGSLHDNKLFIAFTHNELDDLEDMEEKMVARTMLRYIVVDGKPMLVGTNLYGDNETKDMLDKGLKQLNGFGIYSRNQMHNGEYHEESANGVCELNNDEEVYICQEFEEEVSCDCPACNGSGTFEVETRNSYENVSCPACGGSGTTYTYATASIDEYVTVESSEEVYPYAEGYSHYGNRIKILVDKTVIQG